MKQAINWSELRAAAIALDNVNEAAKRAAVNLPPIEQRRFIERVNKRSQREKWIAKANKLTPVVANEMPLSKTVQSGSDVLANTLQTRRDKSKLHLSDYVEKASHRASQLQGRALLKQSGDVKNVAQIHAGLWPEEEQGQGTVSGLRVYSKQTIVHVDQRKTSDDFDVMSDVIESP